MKPIEWLPDKILQSKFYKWLIIMTTIIGLLVGILTLIDWIGDNFIYDKVFGTTLKIEQTIDPEVLKNARKTHIPIRIEKGITVYPPDEKQDKDN